MTTPALSVVGGRYVLGEVIAIGGMSTVHAAEDLETGRPVALKVFRISGDPMAAERLRQEGELLAGLAHPHLVHAYDAGADDDGSGAWLALELLTGPNVATALHAAGPFPLGDVRRLLRDVATALAYIHGLGIVHRDVKPANVLLTADPRTDRDWRAKLADFGIATRLEAGTALVGETAVGTAAYFSPEQTRGEPVTTASDIYSLGLVVLEALTGRRAFPGGAIESATARLFHRAPVPAWLDDGWRALLETMTAPDPCARPTAAQVEAACASLASAPTGERLAPSADRDPEAHTEPATLLALAPAGAPARGAAVPVRVRRRPRLRVPSVALDRLARRALVASSAGVLLLCTAAGGTALIAAAPAAPLIPLADELPTVPPPGVVLPAAPRTTHGTAPAADARVAARPAARAARPAAPRPAAAVERSRTSPAPRSTGATAHRQTTTRANPGRVAPKHVERTTAATSTTSTKGAAPKHHRAKAHGHGHAKAHGGSGGHR